MLQVSHELPTDMPLSLELPQGQLFPDSADIFQQDPLADCMRVGVGMCIADERSRLVMLSHYDPRKCAPGAWGFVTETVQWLKREDGYIPETTLETMARASHEELGLDGNTLGLQARQQGAWFLDKLPAGDNLPGQKILAIITALRIGTDRAEQLVDSFTPVNEIEKLKLMTVREIERNGNLRGLTMPILSGLLRKRLLEPADHLVEVTLPHIMPSIGASDLIPSRLSIARAS